MRIGSTSTRRRPCARAGARSTSASASHSCPIVGARKSARPPERTHDCRARERSRSHAADDGVRIPADLGNTAEGRQCERRAPGALRCDHGGGIAAGCCREDLVLGDARLHQQRASPVGRAEEPRRPHEQPERLLGRPEPGREQLLVEVEERDQADGPRRRRCRRGGAAPRSRPRRRTPEAVRSPRRPRSRGGARRARRRRLGRCVTPGRSFLKTSGAAAPATGGLDGFAPLAAMGAVTFDRRRASQRAQRAIAPQLRHDDQVGAPAAIQDAHRATVRVERRGAARDRAPTRAGRRPGGSSRMVDDVERAANPRADVGRVPTTIASPASSTASVVGARGHERERGARPRGALGDQVPRVPRRCALLLASASSPSSRTIDAGEVGHGREHRDPPPDHDARSPPRVVPRPRSAAQPGDRRERGPRADLRPAAPR